MVCRFMARVGMYFVYLEQLFGTWRLHKSFQYYVTQQQRVEVAYEFRLYERL
jgi:hypothetical protein